MHIQDDALKALWQALKLLEKAEASHYLLLRMRELISLAEEEMDESDD